MFDAQKFAFGFVDHNLKESNEFNDYKNMKNCSQRAVILNIMSVSA